MSTDILTWYHTGNLLDRYQFGMLYILLQVDRRGVPDLVKLIDRILKGKYQYYKYYKPVHAYLLHVATDPFVINTKFYTAVITRNSMGLTKDDCAYLERLFKRVKSYFNRHYYPDRFLEITTLYPVFH